MRAVLKNYKNKIRKRVNRVQDEVHWNAYYKVHWEVLDKVYWKVQNEVWNKVSDEV